MAERLFNYLGDWTITTAVDYLAKVGRPVYLSTLKKNIGAIGQDTLDYVVKQLESKGLAKTEKDRIKITEMGSKLSKKSKEFLSEFEQQ